MSDELYDNAPLEKTASTINYYEEKIAMWEERFEIAMTREWCDRYGFEYNEKLIKAYKEKWGKDWEDRP